MDHIDYSRHYRWWHDDSDAHFEAMKKSEARWLKSYVPSDPSARILDIGCGMGFAVAGMQSLYRGYVEGIDSEEHQVRKAMARGLAVTLVATNDTLSWLDRHKSQYDLITAIDVLEHVPVQAQIPFLRAIFLCLKPAGTFVCRVPNANSGIAARYRYDDWTHQCAFTEHSLDFVLYNSGFSEIEISETPPYRLEPKLSSLVLGFFRAFRRLELMAELGKKGASAPLSPNIIGKARRAVAATALKTITRPTEEAVFRKSSALHG